MRRFHFTLDPVLRLRRRQEEQAQLELAGRQRDLDRARAAARVARTALREFALQRAVLQRDTVEVRILVEADRYHHALAGALSEREQQVGEAAAAVEAALNALLQRRIERESIERLRARRQEAHGAEEQRAEQHSLDEAAVQRWGRK